MALWSFAVRAETDEASNAPNRAPAHCSLGAIVFSDFCRRQGPGTKTEKSPPYDGVIFDGWDPRLMILHNALLGKGLLPGDLIARPATLRKTA
jgi:hypothetical protein